MATNSIITGWEVVKYGPMDRDFPVTRICNHIMRIEQEVFRKCYLGRDFRSALIADKKEYPNVQTYNKDTTYNIGDAIYYDGIRLVSAKANNTMHPDNDPLDDPYWIVGDKFKTPKYNTLWDNYMKYWLAYEVAHGSILFATIQAGAKGLIKIFDDASGISGAKTTDISAWKRECKNAAIEIRDNMYDYMIEETESNGGDDFSEIEQIKAECGCDSECKHPREEQTYRRFHFKH